MATYGSSMAHSLTNRWPAASEDYDKPNAAACKSHIITLSFTDPDVEAQYLAEVAAWRWPVLIIIFAFDIFIWCLRGAWQLISSPEALTCASAQAHCNPHATDCLPSSRVSAVRFVRMSVPQIANLVLLHGTLWCMNFRSRRSGERAARQEEAFLAVLIALAVTNLVYSLTPDNGTDYIYAVFFLICCASYLKIRWWVGMAALAFPTFTAMFKSSTVLTSASKQHLVVAWLAGALMAWLAESYRRCTFAGQHAAKLAHTKELAEKMRHLRAQEELTSAREEAAQRALVVMRERAANEAKSEFMSLMCHEVRTPLNGCLASAEMLLDTPLLDEQRELTNTIRISGSILLSTVSNFLDYFKVQAGKKLDIVRTPFYLMDIISDVHAIVEAMMGHQSPVRLLPPESETPPTCLMGDPDRLKGVLLNLYSNAAKFTREGFICVRVRRCLANEVASETLLDPERSYRLCLQSLQRVRRARAARAAGSSLSDDGCAGGLSMEAAARAAADGGGRGQQPWWQTCLEGGEEPAWEAWQPCSLPPTGSPPGSMSLTEQKPPATDGSSAGAASSPAAAKPSAAPAVVTGASLTEVRGAARTTRSDPGRRSTSLRTVQKHNSASFQGSVEAQESGGSSSVRGPSSHLEGSADAADPSGGSAHGGRGAATGKKKKSQHRNSKPSSRAALDLPGHVMVVEVVDTGTGVSESARQRLFGQFVQGSETEMDQPRSVSGTGLGLSICARQMKVLGGSIGATSNPDHGSIFWFCFPIEEPAGDHSSMPLSLSWHPPSSQAVPAGPAPVRARRSLPAPAAPDMDITLAPPSGGSAAARHAARSAPVAAAAPVRRAVAAVPHPASAAHPSDASSSQALSSPMAPTTITTTSNSPPTGSSFLRSSHSTRYSGQSRTSYGSYNTIASGLGHLGQPLISETLEDDVPDEHLADTRVAPPAAGAGPWQEVHTPTATGPSAGVTEVARQLSAPPGAAPLFLSLASDSLLYRRSAGNAPAPPRGLRGGNSGSGETSRRDRSRDDGVHDKAAAAAQPPQQQLAAPPPAPPAAPGPGSTHLQPPANAAMPPLPMLHPGMSSPHLLSTAHTALGSMPGLPHMSLPPHPAFMHLQPPSAAAWPDPALAMWPQMAHLYGLQVPVSALPPTAYPPGFGSAPPYATPPGAVWPGAVGYQFGAYSAALAASRQPGVLPAPHPGMPPTWSPALPPGHHSPAATAHMHAPTGFGSWDPPAPPPVATQVKQSPLAVGVPILPAAASTAPPLPPHPPHPPNAPTSPVSLVTPRPINTAQAANSIPQHYSAVAAASPVSQLSPDTFPTAQHVHPGSAGMHGPGMHSTASAALTSRRSRDASVPDSHAGSSSVCDSLSAWGQPRSQGDSFDEARGRARGSLELANALPHAHAPRSSAVSLPQHVGGLDIADGHAAQHTAAAAGLLAPVSANAPPGDGMFAGAAIETHLARTAHHTLAVGMAEHWRHELALVPEASHEGTHEGTISSAGDRSTQQGRSRRGSAAGSSRGSDGHAWESSSARLASASEGGPLYAVEDPFSRTAKHAVRAKRASPRGSVASVADETRPAAAASGMPEGMPGVAGVLSGEGMAVASVSTVHSVHGGWGGSEDGLRSRTGSQRSFGEEPGGSTPHDYGIEGVRVLLAEDNLINQMVAKKMLTALGAHVSVVSNGLEALNRIRAMHDGAGGCRASCAAAAAGAAGASAPPPERFDVVLMDMAMPVMDGITAAAEVRKLGCRVPIVAMTANISDRDRADCQASGMDGFLSKPILKGRLGRAVRQVIAKGTLFSDVSEGSSEEALGEP